jgi:hypothetical protein
MGVQDIVRLVLPKEDRFFDYLEQQAKLAHEGVQLLARLQRGAIHQVREEIHAVEKKGDKVCHELEDALAKTFVTPLDREDIHKLSSMLDDILDRAYACASAFDMFCVDTPSEDALKFFGVLEKTTSLLAQTLPALRKHDWATIREATRSLKVLEKEGDTVYRETMKRLFSANLDAASLIREKEIIEILENAVDTCEDAGEYLANLAVKHG